MHTHTHVYTHNCMHTHTYIRCTHTSVISTKPHSTSVMEAMETCTDGDTVSETPPPPPPPLSNNNPSSPASPPSPTHNHNQQEQEEDTSAATSAGTRTADQVALSAKAAGLTNTTGPVQLLRFSEQLNSDEIKLLEVPSNVLQALKQGDR